MNLKESDLIIVAQNLCLPTHHRFLHEAKKMGLKASFLSLQNYGFTISRSSFKKSPYQKKWALHRTTGVNFDEFDLRVAAHLQKYHFQISNPLELLTSLRDKVAQLQALERWDTPIIPSLILRGEIEGDNHTNIQQFIKEFKCARFILKTERGNQGLGVSLINGIDSLYSWLTTLKATGDQRFILQPFIEDAKEYRVLMSGNQCLGVVEKEPRSHSSLNFKNNAKHSRFKAVPSSPKRNAMITCAQGLQEKMRGDFIAIDFLMTKKELTVLEMGLCPGFLEFEKACKINVAAKVLKNLFQ